MLACAQLPSITGDTRLKMQKGDLTWLARVDSLAAFLGSGGGGNGIYGGNGTLPSGGTTVTVPGQWQPLVLALDAASGGAWTAYQATTDYSSDDAYSKYFVGKAPLDSFSISAFDNGTFMQAEGGTLTVTSTDAIYIIPSTEGRMQVSSIDGGTDMIVSEQAFQVNSTAFAGTAGKLEAYPDFVQILVDSLSPSSGWTRLSANTTYAELQAADNNTPNSLATVRASRYAGSVAPSVLISVEDSNAAIAENRIFVDTAGVIIQTGATGDGNPGDVLHSNGVYSYWAPGGSGGGEANTAANVGDGAGQVYKEKSGVELRFRTIKAGSNVTVTNNTNDVTIAATGEANTASNVGGGTGTIYVGKTGVDLEFKTISATGGLNIVNSSSQITLSTKAPQPPAAENVHSSDFTATNLTLHQVDCSGGARIVTPPPTPQIGNRFAVVDARAASATNNITINFTTASQKLYGTIQNYIINANGGYAEFIYMGSSTGWVATKG